MPTCPATVGNEHFIKNNMTTLKSVILLLCLLAAVGFDAKAQQKLTIDGQLYELTADGQLVKIIAAEKQTATDKKRSIKGRIVSENGDGVAYATVALIDSLKQIAAIRATDQKGSFDWGNIAMGSYTLEVSCIGFLTGRFDIEVASDTDNIGTFSITEGTVLDELVVKADRILVKTEPDRIIYNVSDDPDADKLNTKSIMEKVPWIQLNPQSNKLTVMGSTNFEILINGRRTLLASASDQYLLEVLKAKEVKSIEVITAPDGRYIDRKAVINLIVEDVAFLQGFAATINAQAGSAGSLSTNDGVTVKAGGVIANLSIMGIYDKPFYGGEEWTRSEYYDNVEVARSDSYRSRNGMTTRLLPQLRASYELSARDIIVINGLYSNSSIDHTDKLTNNFFDSDVNLLRRYNTNNHNTVERGQLSLNAYYEHYFADNSQKTLTVQYLNDLFSNRFSYNSTITPVVGISPESNWTGNVQNDTEQTFAVNFYNPFGERQDYNLTAKYIIRDYVTNESKFSNAGIESPTGRMDYRLKITSLRGSYSIGWQNFRLSVGANVDYAEYDINYLNVDSPSKRHSWSSDQNITLNYKASNISTFRLTANSKTLRPSALFLNPYVNRTNPNYITTGNPNLKDEHTYNASLSYSMLLYRKLTLGVEAGYSQTNGAIMQYSSITDDGTMLSTYDNIGQNGGADAELTIKYHSSQGTISVDIYGSLKSAQYLGNRYEYLNYGFNVLGSLNLWKGASLSTLIMATSSNNTSVEAYKPHLDYSSMVGLTQTLGSWRLGLSVNDFFGWYRTSITENRSNVFYYYKRTQLSNLSVGMSVSYTFGELNKRVANVRHQVMNTDKK